MAAPYNDVKVRLNHTVVCHVHRDSTTELSLHNFIIFHHKIFGETKDVVSTLVQKLGGHAFLNSVPAHSHHLRSICPADITSPECIMFVSGILHILAILNPF